MMLIGIKRNLLFILAFAWSISAPGQKNLVYQRPPENMARIAEAPPTPGVSVNPSGTLMLVMERPGMPSIRDLASEELRLGGIRIDPAVFGPSRRSYITGLKVMNIDGSREREITGLPDDVRILDVAWSPDGRRLAFSLLKEEGIELWVADMETAAARVLTGPELNATLGRNAFTWMPGGEEIVYKVVPSGTQKPPEKPKIPAGPVVQENIGKKAAVRTYQDMLSDPYDEDIFEYYTTSQLVRIDMQKNRTLLGDPGIISGMEVSPDGNYLLVEEVHRPFSYLVPYYSFPHRVEIWDREGDLVRLVADIPLAEDIPQGFDAVRKGPRSFAWRSDVPATLYWVEALDEGDPSKEAEYRDRLYMLPAPFTEDPVPGISFGLRYRGITWGNDQLAVATEYWRKTRQMRVYFFTPGETEKTLVFDLNTEDRYNDPGSFETTYNKSGKRVLLFGGNGKFLYLTGRGASEEGDRPFIDRYRITNGEIKRLWRSEPPWYETPVSLLNVRKGIVLTNRQSKTEVPNYYLRNLNNGQLTQITDFPHPYPELKEMHKEMVFYKREDGVQLSFELYLPPGYKKEDGPLPTFLWAYPREYKSADAAGQVSGSPYTFTRISNTSPILWVTQGYAILNNAAFPIVGEGEQEPNDTFVEQLVANAKAAIDKAVEMGVTDRQRVAVGGHSYGAFMTANLLAHSDLFAAGIARSGAYNRTLTPFGFQAEPRTYWQAPHVYNQMSPFMHADKINEPLLLIHGMADNNSGTFPIQSERLYAAIKGHGGIVRLVMLPMESHGYAARESVLHTLWEMNEWLETYVKERK
ncbi:MAG TPA: S9 family peptidase [Bacteroidetes bacterium]|nr:S9 family peptidase [Bacteroidota bacterium]